MQSGLWERLLPAEGSQRRQELLRVKSGDPIFDSGYRIKGYPEDVLRELLTSRRIQAA